MKTERFLIKGRVQGVGFRAFVQREAARLALDGWVRNRGFDEVEAVLAGEAAALDDFAARALIGPPAARVASLERAPADPESSRLAGGSRGCVALASL